MPALALLLAVAGIPLAGARAAQAGPDDATLSAGAEVYASVCAACHQAGGVGLSGEFPPLVDNPNVDDADYVATVIREGLSGEIVVNGESFDGVMPPQPGISDDDVVAVVAYVQSGFAAPAVAAPEVDTGPVAGTDLPLLADYAVFVAFAVAVIVGLVVFAPRLLAANNRREITWLDAWLKTGVIVVGLIVATTILPAKVLEMGAVQDLPRTAQDLIAVGIWGVAVLGSLWGLWFAHREDRV